MTFMSTDTALIARAALTVRGPFRSGDTDIEIVRTGGQGRPMILLPGAGDGRDLLQAIACLRWGARDMLSVTYPALSAPTLADAVLAPADQCGGEFDLLGSSCNIFCDPTMWAGKKDMIVDVALDLLKQRDGLHAEPIPVMSEAALDNLRRAP